MPNLANITIKKSNGTTDIVYSGKIPSSGDGAPAVWRSETVGSAMSHQPELRLAAREAGKGSKRAIRATYVYPQIATNTTTGVTSVIDRAFGSLDFTLPKGMPTADALEAAHQFLNLASAALIKQCVAEGTSAS
jgi:hypothetical protein